jgi:septal ring factor EnvC (AmiA/AmiB activator)
MKRLSTYRNHILKLSSLCLFAVLLLMPSGTGRAQNKNELERQRRQKENEIGQTKKRLAETNSKEKKTLAYLRDLSKLIEERQSLIGTLRNEFNAIARHIADEGDLVTALEGDMDELKQEYAKLLYFMYKNRKSTNMVSFVFATNSFNDALKRVKFIQFYTSYREKQVDMIMKTEASLASRITDLKSQQEAKREVLASLGEEERSLEGDKKEQSALMQKLQQDEKGLQRKLEAQQRAAKQLDNAIRNVIKKEIASANKKSRTANKTRSRGSRHNTNNSPANKTNPKVREEDLESTPEITELSAKFAGNRSKLPWPVEKGAITEHFGTHEHPTISKVTVNCNGVVIKSPQGSKARCIFGGTVTAVISIPGANNAIIVSHGNYFTVYSNLDNVFVHKGDKISVRQELGMVGVNRINGETEIELEIWKAPDQKLDPEGWLQRR